MPRKGVEQSKILYFFLVPHLFEAVKTLRTCGTCSTCSTDLVEHWMLWMKSTRRTAKKTVWNLGFEFYLLNYWVVFANLGDHVSQQRATDPSSARRRLSRVRGSGIGCHSHVFETEPPIVLTWWWSIIFRNIVLEKEGFHPSTFSIARLSFQKPRE